MTLGLALPTLTSRQTRLISLMTPKLLTQGVHRQVLSGINLLLYGKLVQGLQKALCLLLRLSLRLRLWLLLTLQGLVARRVGQMKHLVGLLVLLTPTVRGV